MAGVLPMDDLIEFNDDIIKLVIGPDRQEFFVHAIHLTRASAFFEAAFKRDTWKESQERMMELPEDDPELFHFLLHFACADTLPYLITDLDKSADPAAHVEQYTPLAKLYCVGQKYQMPGFKNAIADAIITKSEIADLSGKRWYPEALAVDIIYRGTPEKSPAKRLMVDLLIGRVSGSQLDTGEYPAEFVKDLAKRLLTERQVHGKPIVVSRGGYNAFNDAVNSGWQLLPGWRNL